jgi:undecaprenyl-diphosphatase
MSCARSPGTLQVLRGSLRPRPRRSWRGPGHGHVPAVIVGAILALTGWVDLLRNATVIGWMMILFGIFLWWAHRTAPETRRAGEWPCAMR